MLLGSPCGGAAPTPLFSLAFLLRLPPVCGLGVGRSQECLVRNVVKYLGFQRSHRSPCHLSPPRISFLFFVVRREAPFFPPSRSTIRQSSPFSVVFLRPGAPYALVPVFMNY